MMMSKRSKRRLNAKQRSSARVSKASSLASDYLVVVDFEATCEKNAPDYEHEIIEFPAVLLRTADVTVVDEFHTYVRPTENSTLSAFCTELTGINQTTVDAAPTLAVALRNFNSWLEGHGLPPDKAAKALSVLHPEDRSPEKSAKEAPAGVVAASADGASRLDPADAAEAAAEAAEAAGYEAKFALCTDGPWDLKHFLAAECLRKGGELDRLHADSPHLQLWVNLRWLHAQFYNKPRMGVSACLRYHRLTFEGRPHSGIDDTRNIARIAQRLLLDGCGMPLNDGLAPDLAVHWSAPKRHKGRTPGKAAVAARARRKSGGSRKERAAARAAENGTREALLARAVSDPAAATGVTAKSPAISLCAVEAAFGAKKRS